MSNAFDRFTIMPNVYPQRFTQIGIKACLLIIQWLNVRLNENCKTQKVSREEYYYLLNT